MHTVNLLPDESRVSKLSYCSRPSFIGPHAARDVVLGLHIEMNLDVPDDFGISIFTMNQTPDHRVPIQWRGGGCGLFPSPIVSPPLVWSRVCFAPSVAG